METTRGRWFLEEHARRSRGADTGRVLEAIARLEAMIPAAPAIPDDRAGLQALAGLLAESRRGLAAAGGHNSVRDTARGALAAIRRSTDKIREVAFELRESARLDIYANALDLYCGDVVSACGLEEAAIRQLDERAAILDALEEHLGQADAAVAAHAAAGAADAAVPALPEPAIPSGEPEPIEAGAPPAVGRTEPDDASRRVLMFVKA